MSRTIFRTLTLLALCALISPVSRASAQGATTSGLTGIVKDPQDAVIPGVTITAVHVPSSTTYEAVTQTDGRYFIPGMRVGGPYKVTATLSGFRTAIQNDISLNLGIVQDVSFKLELATISEDVIVIGATSPVFASTRTGAATAVLREDLATLPTISGRITDITRLSPQYGGSGTFAGQDNRANNMTIDGSYFNNSFGLGVTTGGVGDRTGVAPISLEAIEQVQVSVAPYDVRQGNFVGANVNTVTRSGTNSVTASVYKRTRNQSYVGKEANGQTFNPGTFDTSVTGTWAGGPIMKNKWFVFGSFEKQDDTRPLSTFRANNGGEPVAGNVTRVLNSDMQGLSDFLKKNFNYDTGVWNVIPKVTPAKPWMIKSDYNINSSNKVTFRYNQLDSSTDALQSGGTSLGNYSRSTTSTQFLSFANTNYQILENLKSGVGEWNSVFGTSTNNLLVGYTHQDESRGAKGQDPAFPFVVIGDGAGTAEITFGNEPFTPKNLLRYNTFQLQDSVTKFATNHSFTFGGNFEKFHSDNSFYFGVQSAYTYASLNDFYTDANSYLANPNRTVSPVNLVGFQVKYLLQPGQSTPPLQPLDVIYGGAYAQDSWRPTSNLTVTYGLRVDVPRFGATGFDNPAADALTFRDQDGSAVHYNTGKLPSPTPYWSPRAGFNYDPKGDQQMQFRGGTGVFSGKPPYVWISNQIGNTGVLAGFLDTRPTTPITAFPFNPNPDTYKPAPTGGAAASYELDLTDNGYRFPQTWRTNAGFDRRLPWGLTGTIDYIYNRDLNAPMYINANLPAANSAFTGVDPRPRWAVGPNAPACITTIGSENGPCVTKINNAKGNDVTANYVLKDESQNRSWNISGQLKEALWHGLEVRGGFNYGVSRSLIEPSSTVATIYGGNGIVTDPNNPPLAYSQNSPGKRVFAVGSYTAKYFSLGSTTVALFYDGHTNGNTSYMFATDANGDGYNNDLIYIPRNTSEMNFAQFTSGGTTFTAADQAAAFEKLIQSDPYLSSHRGQYAERNAVFLPVVNRVDFSLIQDVFGKVGGRKHAGQIRLDITNFGNLLNHNWGVGTRLVNNLILTNPTVDANGALSYRLQTSGGQLISSARQTSAGITDVYVAMLSFRYTFQ
ncbi:MAG TPA: carboxypeptidase regulatory-like domain-containing protein [Vicinamibacterales bacterium]